MHYSVAILALGVADARGGLQRVVNPINTAGGCKFGDEFCDSHGRSYGCERFNDDLAICWSECVGNIIKPSNQAETMRYDGWCYSLNETVVAPPMTVSGKQGRYRRDEGDDHEEHDDYYEYDWAEELENMGKDGYIMGVPLHQFHTCNTDADCTPLMLRGCAIGCGNFPEYQKRGIKNINYVPRN